MQSMGAGVVVGVGSGEQSDTMQQDPTAWLDELGGLTESDLRLNRR